MIVMKSNYMIDEKLFNNGREANLINIENENDYDTLLSNIVQSNYYDKKYFENRIGYKQHKVKFDNLMIALIIEFLEPGSVIELGCGRGDILFLLYLNNHDTIRGIDFSEDILKDMMTEIRSKVDCGDIL